MMERTYKYEELTNYEKEVRNVCLAIRTTETIEQAISIFLGHLHKVNQKYTI